MADFAPSQLGTLLSFSNGRSSPERDDSYPFPVYGSNGIIGYAKATNANANTIVIGRVGSYCGSLYFAKSQCWVTDNAIKASAKDENDSIFLYYLLSTLGLNNWRAGSGQPLLNQQILSSIPVSAPTPEIQKTISALLAALDDKIELNRRMNETLEAMARTIFRDWFVDFGPTRAKLEAREPYLVADLWQLFPDRLDGNGVPEGWERFTLADLADQHTASVSPAATPDTEFEHFSIPAYDKGQQPAIDTGDSIKSNKTVVPNGAVLMSKLNPEIKRVWLLPEPEARQQICSTEFIVYTPRGIASRSLLYSLFCDDQFQIALQSMVTGTSKSHQRISPPALLKQEVLCGATSVFEAFDALCRPWLARVLANRSESSELSAMRDLLLPKLMLGEITLKSAEKAAGDVT